MNNERTDLLLDALEYDTNATVSTRSHSNLTNYSCATDSVLTTSFWNEVLVYLICRSPRDWVSGMKEETCYRLYRVLDAVTNVDQSRIDNHIEHFLFSTDAFFRMPLFRHRDAQRVIDALQER